MDQKAGDVDLTQDELDIIQSHAPRLLALWTGLLRQRKHGLLVP